MQPMQDSFLRSIPGSIKVESGDHQTRTCYSLAMVYVSETCSREFAPFLDSFRRFCKSYQIYHDIWALGVHPEKFETASEQDTRWNNCSERCSDKIRSRRALREKFGSSQEYFRSPLLDGAELLDHHSWHGSHKLYLHLNRAVALPVMGSNTVCNLLI